jgi:type II secretory pathway predicted ATPase ExeA
MPLRLKAVLAERKISYRVLAGGIGIGAGTLADILNQGKWPKRPERAALEAAIRGQLGEGLPDGVFEEVADAAPTPRPPETQPLGDLIMLPKKHTLSPEARRHFRLVRDPFAAPPETLYLHPDIHLIRELMYQTATAGGFVAVVGESGAGKTALLADLYRRMRGEKVTLIEPYVLDMFDRGPAGKELRMGDILDAIARSLDPKARISHRKDKRTDDVMELLAQSAQGERKHCLILDEAQDCHANTLRGFKRLFDQAYKKALNLSVLLIGQPELALKLNPRNHALREVWQRVDVQWLPPLNGYVGPFLDHLLKPAGSGAEAVFEPAAFAAFEAKLKHFDPSAGEPVSDCYALAAINLAAGAMTLTAKLGAPKVSADIVAEV